MLMGATGILVCSTNSSPLSPAVSKVSAGTMEHFPIFSCSKMHTTLMGAEEAGWRVLGNFLLKSAFVSFSSDNQSAVHNEGL